MLPGKLINDPTRLDWDVFGAGATSKAIKVATRSERRHFVLRPFRTGGFETTVTYAPRRFCDCAGFATFAGEQHNYSVSLQHTGAGPALAVTVPATRPSVG